MDGLFANLQENSTKESLRQFIIENSERISLIIACIQAVKPTNYSTQKPTNSYKKIMEQNNLIGDYVGIETKSDGNCFYYATSIGLFGSPIYYKMFKIGLMKVIMAHEKELEEILRVTCTKKTFENILSTSFTDFAWATEYHCLSLSILLRRPVNVFGIGRMHHKYCAVKSRSQTKPLCLLFENNHFSALMPRSESSKFVSQNFEQFYQLEVV